MQQKLHGSQIQKKKKTKLPPEVVESQYNKMETEKTMKSPNPCEVNVMKKGRKKKCIK